MIGECIFGTAGMVKGARTVRKANWRHVTLPSPSANHRNLTGGAVAGRINALPAIKRMKKVRVQKSGSPKDKAAVKLVLRRR